MDWSIGSGVLLLVGLFALAFVAVVAIAAFATRRARHRRGAIFSASEPPEVTREYSFELEDVDTDDPPSSL